MTIETGWVKPPQESSGLDHLGVQAPCIQIYGDLLPGITNVTDRARYYSFFPWLLNEFEKRGWRSPEEIQTMLRRAECLLTLVGLRHALLCDDDGDDHRAAMVGNDALGGAITRWEQGDVVRLSEYALTDDHPNRYFANRYGALGQYYFGTLYGLSLLDGQSAANLRIPKETGQVLAQIVAKSVPGDPFIQALADDEIDSATLDALQPFCSCQLKHSTEECQMLIAILQQGWPALCPDESPTADEMRSSASRAKSLSYLCRLADIAAQADRQLDMHEFRSMIYTRADASGAPIELPPSFEEIAHHWQVYQRNELLSVGMQGLFYVTLRAGELSDRSFHTTTALSEWFWVQDWVAEVAGFKPGETINMWMEQSASQLPALAQWLEPQHEMQCAQRVSRGSVAQSQTTDEQENLASVLRDSLLILSALFERPENATAYGDYVFPERYLDSYPVNLSSMIGLRQSEWQNSSVADGMTRFVCDNCLDAHLRVAMRKLRQQGKNTFRFEPSEIGLVIKSLPKAANTTPRFKQAVRILLDVGLLERNNGILSASDQGHAFIEANQA